ncbi:MAG TPA: ribosome biogenesis factor YjgA [Burkholderiaceae bacterium]|nr:ribosome biogenesis factor YjgA [Burkholderiaceae bacterium]
MPVAPRNHETIEHAQPTPRQPTPSKSERKRQMQSLQQLGQELVQLSAASLARLPIEPDLLAAILDAQTITAHEAKRRQLQYIGKLMRHADANAIGAQLRDLQHDSHASVQRMHACERWRERLLADDTALTELADRYPRIDMQPFRALIRNARREHAAGKAPKSARQLYRNLHTLLANDQESE